MANVTGRPIAPARKLVAAVLGTIAVFVMVFGLGMSSWAIVALGAALLALAVALGMINVARRGARAWIAGHGQVDAVSDAPTTGAYGRAELQLLVVAPGLPVTQVTVREPRVPVGKWPRVGDTLPLTVDVDDMRRVRIDWGQSPDHGDDGDPPPPPGYDQSDEYLDDDLLGEPEPPPWANRDRQWGRGPDEPPPPPPPAADPDVLTSPIVVRDTPLGPVLEGQVVDRGGASAPLPHRARQERSQVLSDFPAAAAPGAAGDFAAAPPASAYPSAAEDSPYARPATTADPAYADPAYAEPPPPPAPAYVTEPPPAQPAYATEAPPPAQQARAAESASPPPRGSSARGEAPAPAGSSAPAESSPPAGSPASADSSAPAESSGPAGSAPGPTRPPGSKPSPRRPRPHASAAASAGAATATVDAPSEAPAAGRERRAAASDVASRNGTATDAPDPEIDLPLDGDPEPPPEFRPEARSAMDSGIIAPPADPPATAAGPAAQGDSPTTAAGSATVADPLTTAARSAAPAESRATDRDDPAAADKSDQPGDARTSASDQPGDARTSAAGQPGHARTAAAAAAGAAAGLAGAHAVSRDEAAALRTDAATAPGSEQQRPAPDAELQPDAPAGVGKPWADLETGGYQPDERAGDLITPYPSARPGTAGAIHGVGITVLVTDLARSAAFYRDTLGFFEIDHGAGSAVLASGDTRLVLRAVQGPSPDVDRLLHLNLEVGDVEAVHDELTAKGVTFERGPHPVDRGDKLELWAATFHDPDGHTIAITQWRAVR